jgi:hypothetical protein
MSRGPGRIERAIAAILDGEADNAFTTEDLCERVYSGVNRVEKKHRVAVLRAANRLVKRRDNTDCWRSDNLGGTRVYFNIDNVMSYVMARLKADNLNHYRSNDDRWFLPSAMMRRLQSDQFRKGYVYQWSRSSEAELRAKLAEGGQNHKNVVPGGVWWKHTQFAIAEMEAKRVGDTKRLEEIKAERKADWEAFERELLPGLREQLSGLKG